MKIKVVGAVVTEDEGESRQAHIDIMMQKEGTPTVSEHGTVQLAVQLLVHKRTKGPVPLKYGKYSASKRELPQKEQKAVLDGRPLEEVEGMLLVCVHSA